MVTGAEIFSYCEFDKDHDAFINLRQPLVLSYHKIKNNVSISLAPFGCYNDEAFVRIRFSHIVALSHLSSDFKELYKGALVNFGEQKEQKVSTELSKNIPLVN